MEHVGRTSGYRISSETFSPREGRERRIGWATIGRRTRQTRQDRQDKTDKIDKSSRPRHEWRCGRARAPTVERSPRRGHSPCRLHCSSGHGASLGVERRRTKVATSATVQLHVLVTRRCARRSPNRQYRCRRPRVHGSTGPRVHGSTSRRLPLSVLCLF